VFPRLGVRLLLTQDQFEAEHDGPGIGIEGEQEAHDKERRFQELEEPGPQAFAVAAVEPKVVRFGRAPRPGTGAERAEAGPEGARGGHKPAPECGEPGAEHGINLVHGSGQHHEEGEESENGRRYDAPVAAQIEVPIVQDHHSSEPVFQVLLRSRGLAGRSDGRMPFGFDGRFAAT